MFAKAATERSERKSEEVPARHIAIEKGKFTSQLALGQTLWRAFAMPSVTDKDKTKSLRA